jgi:hypothetical protein
VLAGLDSATLDKFGRLCSMSLRIGEQAYVVESAGDREGSRGRPHHVGTGGYIGQEFDNYEISQTDIAELRSAGLVGSGPHGFYIDLREHDGATDIDYAGRPAALVCADDIAGAGPQVEALSLSRAGLELRSAMTLKQHPEYTARFLEVLQAGGYYLTIEPD